MKALGFSQEQRGPARAPATTQNQRPTDNDQRTTTNGQRPTTNGQRESMSRTPTASADSALRAIPAVERVLSGAALAPLIASYGRARVKEALTAHLRTLREERVSWDEPAAVAAITAAVAQATGSSLRRVINGSGVIIPTELL